MIWVSIWRFCCDEPGPLTTATSLSPVALTKALAPSVADWARAPWPIASHAAETVSRKRREGIRWPRCLLGGRECSMGRGGLREPHRHRCPVVIFHFLDL